MWKHPKATAANMVSVWGPPQAIYVIEVVQHDTAVLVRVVRRLMLHYPSALLETSRAILASDSGSQIPKIKFRGHSLQPALECGYTLQLQVIIQA